MGGAVESPATGALARDSLVIAIAVGADLGVPGPFDVLAIGRMTTAGHSVIASIGVIIYST
jgi:hypothetical protein